MPTPRIIFATSFAVLDLPADLAAELEVQPLVVDRPRAVGVHVDAPLGRRDQDRASLWEEDTARVRQLIKEGEASGISEVDPFEFIESLIAKHKPSGA